MFNLLYTDTNGLPASKNIQTVDLITVEEDDIRTEADRKLSNKLEAIERDRLISAKFYDLIFYK